MIAAIQNLGYRPTSPKPDPETIQAYKTSISTLNQSQIQAYTTYHICSFLVEVYGTWVNVSPSILLQCLQYFLPVSPLTTYLLTTHLLNAVIHDAPEPTDKERLVGFTKGQKWKVPVVLKNLRYRRQLYVYLIQSIAIAVRLRFHVLYAPTAFPFEIIEHAAGVELSQDERFKRSFMDIFVDLAKRQAELIVNSMSEYTLTEENLYNTASEKSAMYPYIPIHIQQHLGSIFNAIDHRQSPFEFSSYEPYQITRLFITGNIALNPTELASMTSLTLLTRPLPSRDELEPTDPHYTYVSNKLKALGRWQEEEEVVPDDVNASDSDDDDITKKAIMDAYERFNKMSVEIVNAQNQDSQGGEEEPGYADQLMAKFGDALDQQLLDQQQQQQTTHPTSTPTTTHTSPIVTTLGDSSSDSTTTTASGSSTGILYPIALAAVGLLARHRWFGSFFRTQILRIPGVKGLIKILKMIGKVLWGL